MIQTHKLVCKLYKTLFILSILGITILFPKRIAAENVFVSFDKDNAFSYCDNPVCLYDKETNTINISISFNTIPISDDSNIYLYEFSNYENESSFEGKIYVAKKRKNSSISISIPYTTKRLFSRFVPVIFYENNIYALSLGQYITNPEDIAKNNTPYPVIDSKKGILLDPLTIERPELDNLNVKRVVFNIPISFIMGETDNDTYPTVNFMYRGQTYKFNGYMLAGFDSLFKYLSDNNYHITAIVLNDWNKIHPEIIHPMSRNRTYRSMYYAFNTEEKEGVKTMEATALFLASRYSGGEYGLIHDWVIANEINQQKVWNYMNTSDVNMYVTSFEKSFRSFYNAIKSQYSNANIYYSIDQNWNSNNGQNHQFFNAKNIVNIFNEKSKAHGNYDWGLSIHPYPAPLTNTKFWHGYRDKSENASLITPMNLSVITDYMTGSDLLDTKGNVRQIGITELGFSSRSGEKSQAAAFAYCYHIIENNKYINSFLMNRQTDSKDSLKSGLALGIYNPDYSPKYIADVFANIDTKEGDEYLSEMLEIIGASSLEEALSWAK